MSKCVCVCERERERKIDWVSVWERENEKERERETECEQVYERVGEIVCSEILMDLKVGRVCLLRIVQEGEKIWRVAGVAVNQNPNNIKSQLRVVQSISDESRDFDQIFFFFFILNQSTIFFCWRFYFFASRVRSVSVQVMTCLRKYTTTSIRTELRHKTYGLRPNHLPTTTSTPFFPPTLQRVWRR